mmetsp:Transcript_60849/g.131816  ORF Transcript_60849/g.131816 Transcript_60849/m.131816 type:complete len:336 (+) Transcript_60849:151-1158(+)
MSTPSSSWYEASKPAPQTVTASSSCASSLCLRCSTELPRRSRGTRPWWWCGASAAPGPRSPCSTSRAALASSCAATQGCREQARRMAVGPPSLAMRLAMSLAQARLWRAKVAASSTKASSSWLCIASMTVSMPPTLAIIWRSSSSYARLPSVRRPASCTRGALGWRCRALTMSSTPPVATAWRFSGAKARICSTKQAFSCTSVDHACRTMACMAAMTPPTRATSVSMPLPRRMEQRARQPCSCTPDTWGCAVMAWMMAWWPPYSMTFCLPSSLFAASFRSMQPSSIVSDELASECLSSLRMVDLTPSHCGDCGPPGDDGEPGLESFLAPKSRLPA